MGDGEQEIDELRRLMRERGLLPPLPDHLAATPERGEALLSHILASSTGSQLPARRKATWLAAAAVLILVVATVGYGLTRGAPPAAAGMPHALTYSGTDPARVSEAPPAREALTRAASLAAAAAVRAVDGPVQHTSWYGWLLTVRDDGASVDAHIYPTLTDTWLADDGSGRTDQYRATALDVDGRLSRDGTPVLGGQEASDPFPAGTFDPQLTARLSRDPAQLTGQLLAMSAGAPCDRDARWRSECLVRAVQQLYATWVVPPDLAAATWLVLAGQTDVRDLGTTDDRLGRAALAVGLASDPAEPTQRVTVLLISQDAGQLVGVETVTVHDAVLKVTSPAVTGFQTLLSARWVPAVGTR